jgi:hypothetical protein
MASSPERLARLRALVSKTTTTQFGRERVQALLEQEPDTETVACPRYVAIAESAGERLLIADEDPAALVLELEELAFTDIPHIAEAIIDLDTEQRHEAHNTIVIAFTPNLPGVCTRVLRLQGGEHSALRLLCGVAEENADGNTELKEAIAIADALLARAHGER